MSTDRPRTFADEMRDPVRRLARQHAAGVHTDCDRSTCPHWVALNATR